MGKQDSQPKTKTHTGAVIITFVAIVLAVFFGIQLIAGTGIFYKPGQLLFGDTMTEVDRDFVSTNLTDLELKHDLTISTTTSPTKISASNIVLYNILVPVTDFYDPILSISAEDAQNANLISIRDLNPNQKLLAIDDQYFLDTLDSGAFFQYFTLTGGEEDIQTVSRLLSEHIAKFPDRDTILTFAQTGVTALSRGMNARLNQIGDASQFAANIGKYLSSFDLTHTSNEASFSNSAHSRNICALPDMIDTLTAIGLDIVELTGNHNQDCGDQDAISTIDLYNNLGIKTVGGGKTAAEAATPLLIDQKGNHITMLGYNLSTGGYTLDNTPGANFYTEEKAQADIAAAKERGDFIIVDIQYYECNAYVFTEENTTCDYANSAAGDQIGFFRSLIDMGADVIVGTAAHQPQTYEEYHDGFIYYGLGNLFFDQSWWPGTTRSLILVHYFYDNHLVQTRIVPTIYDDTYQTKLLDTAAAEQFLARLIKAKPAQE